MVKKGILIGVLTGLIWVAATGGAAEAPIALIVHPSNSVKNLTVAELARIYKGQKTKWGMGGKIVPTNRPIESLIRKRFYERVLRAKPTRKFLVRGSPIPFKTTRVKSDLATRKFVARVPNAIGYISLSQVDQTVKVLNLDGSHPSDSNYILR